MLYSREALNFARLIMTSSNCSHCKDAFDCDHLNEHPGLCCECLDLSCGKPLDLVNEDRKKAGRPPVRPWPGRGVDGKRVGKAATKPVRGDSVISNR